jgi:hypothetical protein
LFLDELRGLIDHLKDTQASVILVVPLDLVSNLDLLYSEPNQLLLYILVLVLIEEILICVYHWLEDKALVGLH